MIPLLENEKLELKYKPWFWAWTHHLVIPNTSNIWWKWWDLKVSWYIDNYEIKNINLAPRKNEDKIISINKEIRDAIKKKAWDTVVVTLYLIV